MLDEPTNHLDVDAKDFYKAIKAFKGAVILLVMNRNFIYQLLMKC
ncbi:MAG: hypothetical protein ACLRQF_23225 [Thomasclavelia ramosa]